MAANGIAAVTNCEQTFNINKGKSTCIQLGTTYALENQTNKTLKIIAVQTGVYFGEVNVIKFKDIYGKST